MRLQLFQLLVRRLGFGSHTERFLNSRHVFPVYEVVLKARARDLLHRFERLGKLALAIKAPGPGIHISFRRFRNLILARLQKRLLDQSDPLVQFLGSTVQVNQSIAVVILDFSYVNLWLRKTQNVLKHREGFVVAVHALQVHRHQHANSEIRRILRSQVTVKYVRAFTQGKRLLDPCGIADILLPNFLRFHAQNPRIHAAELATVAFHVMGHAFHRGRIGNAFHRSPLIPHGNQRIQHLVGLAVHCRSAISQGKLGLVATERNGVRLLGITHGILRLIFLEGNRRKRMIGTRHIDALVYNILGGIL